MAQPTATGGVPEDFRLLQAALRPVIQPQRLRVFRAGFAARGARVEHGSSALGPHEQFRHGGFAERLFDLLVCFISGLRTGWSLADSSAQPDIPASSVLVVE